MTDARKVRALAGQARLLFGKLDDEHFQILGYVLRREIDDDTERKPDDVGVVPYDICTGLKSLSQSTCYRKIDDLLRRGFLVSLHTRPWKKNPKVTVKQVGLGPKGSLAALGSFQDMSPLELETTLQRHFEEISRTYGVAPRGANIMFEDVLREFFQHLIDRRIDLSEANLDGENFWVTYFLPFITTTKRTELARALVPQETWRTMKDVRRTWQQFFRQGARK